ncbi:MAG: sulfite exporter TauE/SafE family protein [Thermoplasmata archaeon]|nr:sulfite exporter TauE/SafE family protein [Thermoplasmata archaeon]
MLALLPLSLLVLATFGIGVVGSLAGLVLGNLRLPLLLALLPPALAGGTNVTISGAGAGAGVLTHLREGRFDRQAFLIMAPPSIAGALLGGYLAGLVPGLFLVLFVAVIVLEQGVELLWRTSGQRQSHPVIAPPRNARWVGILGAVGLLVGILGGLVGLILGTIRLPALLRAGVPVKDAVATNLAVGLCVGIAGFLGHFAGGTVDSFLVLILIPPAVAGGVLGARISGSFSESGLKRAIGTILVGVGVLLVAFLILRIPPG